MLEPQENLAFDTSSVYTQATIEVTDDESTIFQLVCVDEKLINLAGRKNPAFAEDLSWAACKLQNIEPLAAHLFALRGKDGLWLPPGKSLNSNQTSSLSLRMRFMCNVTVLGKECPNALAYLFLQVHALH
jgi:FERM F1 ubiquitin-like domain